MIPKSQDMSADQKLIKQISAGNELAFAHFYDKHWYALFISAYKILKDEEACKDIVQEVFLNVWEKPNLTKIQNVKAYLYQTVRFKVLMALRKDKISEKHLETIQELVANTTEEQLDFNEVNEVLQNSINSLPKRCKEVFRLSRMENLSNKEISDKLGISIRTVETHISNALRVIRSGVDSSAAMAVLFLLF